LVRCHYCSAWSNGHGEASNCSDGLSTSYKRVKLISRFLLRLVAAAPRSSRIPAPAALLGHGRIYQV
jgi:hypothetical protein